MASCTRTKHVLLTGLPGIGKTTVVKAVCDGLRKNAVQLDGFYTEEVRASGKRIGFDVVTLSGQRGALARVMCSEELPTRKQYRVGQYTVNVDEFEQTALPTLSSKMSQRHGSSVYVIDEIGKMELFSSRFVHSVSTLFDAANTVILATIPVARGKMLHFVETLRQREDVQVITVKWLKSY